MTETLTQAAERLGTETVVSYGEIKAVFDFIRADDRYSDIPDADMIRFAELSIVAAVRIGDLWEWARLLGQYSSAALKTL